MWMVSPALAAVMAACTVVCVQPAAQTSHVTHRPSSQIVPLGHWSLLVQEAQTFSTQAGVGLAQEPQVSLPPHPSSITPQIVPAGQVVRGVHFFFGLRFVRFRPLPCLCRFLRR